MKITENKNNKTYNIEVNQFELDVLSYVASHIGGISSFRDVFSNKQDSLFEQSLIYIKNRLAPKIKRSGSDGRMYLDEINKYSEPEIENTKTLPKRDKRGRFIQDLNKFLNKEVQFYYKGERDNDYRCRVIKVVTTALDSSWIEGEDLHDSLTYKRFNLSNMRYNIQLL